MIQLGCLGERCKLPQRVRAEPERYLLHFVLRKASDDSNFTWIFTKEYPQIWQVKRSLFAFIRNLRLLENNLGWSALRRPYPEAVDDRCDTPLECVSEWEVFRMLDNLQPTAAGLDGLQSGSSGWQRPYSAKRSLIYSTCCFLHPHYPRQWKEAKIRPLPKVPAPKQHADYRPISITPIVVSRLTYTLTAW